MTDTPLSRRAFFGTAAAVGVVGALPASEAKPSPLAPEPTPPVGVSQRLGSARFRELTADYKFSADSKWLAQFDGGHFLAYEVATGRRVKWAAKGDEAGWPDWHLANDTVLLWDNNHPAPVPTLWDRDTGHPRKALKFKPAQHHALTADASGLIQYDGKELRRVDVRTGKVEWRRAWKCDASVPVVEYTVTQRWIVGVGVKRLHLFNPLTGKDGPRLEDAPPPDAPPDNHFQPVGFSADNKRLCGYFTADAQPRTVVWDLTTGKVVGRRTMTDTTEPPLLTADGRTLLILDQQARLSGCDVTTGKLTRRLAAQNIGQFVLSPDGAVLAVGWGQQFGPLGGIGAFGGIVGPAAGEGVIRLLNPATGELLPQSPDPSAEVKGVRFADPHSVVTEVDAASSQSSHLVWDVRTGRRRAAINANHPNFGAGLPAPFLCAGFGFNGRQDELSPDGTRCLAEFQSQVVVADAFTGRALHAFDPIQSVEPLFWLGRGKVAKLSAGGLVVWDLDGHTRRTIPLKFNQAGTAVTPDGRTAVFSHSDQDAEEPTAITWVDAASGAVTRRPVERGRMAVSADGNRVAVTVGADAIPEYEGFIRVTVIDRGSRRISFRQATGNVVNEPRAELSPCGRTAYLAHEKPGEGETAEGIPVVQFWEVLSGERRAEYVTPFAAGGLGVSPCGRRVATTHRDAPVYLWDVFGEKTDPQTKPDKSTWGALDGPPDKAFAAIRQLVQHPAAAVELLSAKLTPAEQPKPEWVKARIDLLGSTDFRARHVAELELSAVADRIADPLRKAIAAGAGSPEADERLARLLAKAEGVPRSAWRAVRAVEALEYCECKVAVELLKTLTGGVDSAVLTREATAAVKRRG